MPGEHEPKCYSHKCPNQPPERMIEIVANGIFEARLCHDQPFPVFYVLLAGGKTLSLAVLVKIIVELSRIEEDHARQGQTRFFALLRFEIFSPIRG